MLPQLDLHYSTIKEGRTVLRSGYSRFPLRHSPELHLSESLPSLATCFITNSSGGMFERDQLEVCVRLDADSKLQLLNLSATLLHKCNQLASRETCRFEIGDNAYFEMVRKPLIPTSGSNYEQNSYLEIGRGAIAVIADTVFSGRYSSGERHRYKAIKLGLDVVFQGKRLVSERSGMRPCGGISALRSESGWNCMSTVYCIGIGPDWKAVERETIQALDDPMLEVGCLPNDSGLIARFLCRSSGAASDRIEMFVNYFRERFAESLVKGNDTQ